MKLLLLTASKFSIRKGLKYILDRRGKSLFQNGFIETYHVNGKVRDGSLPRNPEKFKKLGIPIPEQVMADWSLAQYMLLGITSALPENFTGRIRWYVDNNFNLIGDPVIL
ncbi:MAG: hypothetical protein ABFD50_23775 [Smithella sp.]